MVLYTLFYDYMALFVYSYIVIFLWRLSVLHNYELFTFVVVHEGGGGGCCFTIIWFAFLCLCPELSMADERKDKIRIIPVKVDGHSQTGWLQAIISGKLWHTVESVQQVSEKLPKIIDEIEDAKRALNIADKNSGNIPFDLSKLSDSSNVSHFKNMKFHSI